MKLAAYWINFPRDQEYRTLDYVRREVNQLATQLAAVMMIEVLKALR